jgi:hypothetical protein
LGHKKQSGKKKNTAPAARPPLPRPWLGRRFWIWVQEHPWRWFTVLLALVAAHQGYLGYRTKLTVAVQGTPLAAREIFSALFEVTNDGPFAIAGLRIDCVVDSLYDAGSAMELIGIHVGQVLSIDRLPSGTSGTFGCFTGEGVHPNVMKPGTQWVMARITFGLAYSSIGRHQHMTASFRGMLQEDSVLRWVPVPSSRPSGLPEAVESAGDRGVESRIQENHPRR